MSKKNHKNTTIDWNIITNNIIGKKCVLLIGPEVFSTSDSTSKGKVINHLKSRIGDDFDEHFFDYYERHELFDFSSESEQATIYQNMIMFYNEFSQEEVSIYDKIAAISVPLVISLNPDTALSQAFKKYKHHYAYYSQKPQKETEENLEKGDVPYLYYLFGQIDQQTSLILTYDNLLSYIFSLLGKNPDIPNELKNILSRAENFLFLGFRFDQWYMQLITRVLIYQGENKGRIKYVFDRTRYSEDTYLFYSNHFNLTFLDMTPKEFIEKLYDECSQKGLLRSPIKFEESTSINNKIETLLENDELEDVLILLRNYFKSKMNNHETEYDETILLIGQLRTLDKNEREGILNPDDILIYRSKLRKACQALIKYIKF